MKQYTNGWLAFKARRGERMMNVEYRMMNVELRIKQAHKPHPMKQYTHAWLVFKGKAGERMMN